MKNKLFLLSSALLLSLTGITGCNNGGGKGGENGPDGGTSVTDPIANPLVEKTLYDMTNVKMVNLCDINKVTSLNVATLLSKKEREYIGEVKEFLKSIGSTATPKWTLRAGDNYHYAPTYDNVVGDETTATVDLTKIEKCFYCALYTVELGGTTFNLGCGLFDVYDPNDGFVWNTLNEETANKQFYLGGAWNNDAAIDPVTHLNKEKQKSEYLKAEYVKDQTVHGKTGNFIRIDDGNKVIAEDGTETGDVAHGYRMLWMPQHSVDYYDQNFEKDYEVSFDFLIEGDLMTFGSVYKGILINETNEEKYAETKDQFKGGGGTGFAFGEYCDKYYEKGKRIQFINGPRWNHFTFHTSEYAAMKKEMMLSIDDYLVYGPNASPNGILKQGRTYLTNFKVEEGIRREYIDEKTEIKLFDDTFDFSASKYMTAEDKANMDYLKANNIKVEEFLEYTDNNGDTQVTNLPGDYTVSKSLLTKNRDYRYCIRVYYNRTDVERYSTDYRSDSRVVYKKAYLFKF